MLPRWLPRWRLRPRLCRSGVHPHQLSDGKEACAGDPCAAAKALADRFKVVTHTVGLNVGQATRAQLTCVAEQTGGRYFPAESAKELATVLGQAVANKVERRTQADRSL